MSSGAPDSNFESELFRQLVSEAIAENGEKVFVTKCLACGTGYKQTLHWLRSLKFRCPACDGLLDDQMLHQITRSVLSKLKTKTKAQPTETKQAPHLPASRKPTGVTDFQLVLQFSGDSLEDFDALIALENALTEVLGDSADVDGHDLGSGEANIFIFTSDPQATFEALKPTLQKLKLLKATCAAYREVDGEVFTVIWPCGSKRKFSVA